MSQYVKASELAELTDGLIADDKQAFRLVASGVLRPPVTLRLGRRIFFHRERLLEFLEAGGSGLAAGWRHAPSDSGDSEAAGSDRG